MWSLANLSRALRCRFWSKGFFLARQPLRPWRCRTRWTVDLDTSFPAVFNRLQICVFVIIGFFLIRQTTYLSDCRDSLRGLPGRGSDLTIPHSLNFETMVCTVDLGTLNRSPIAPRDHPFLWNSMIRCFKSKLSSFDLAIVVEAGLYQIGPFSGVWEKPSAEVNQDHSQDIKGTCDQKMLNEISFNL